MPPRNWAVKDIVRNMRRAFHFRDVYCRRPHRQLAFLGPLKPGFGLSGAVLRLDGSSGTGTCEEIEFPFFADDRKCIVKCQRSLAGHLIAKFSEAQTRLFPKINFFTASRRDGPR